jgi:type 1 glutamine amidotransferase
MPDLLIIADEWDQMVPLQKCLESNDYSVTSVEDTDVPENLSAYHAVFMYVHKPVEQSAVDAMIRYTRLGGRLVVLHHGIASGKLKNPDWLEFVGIHIEPKDAPTNPWTLMVDVTHHFVNLNPNHYITSNGVTYPERIEYTSGDAPSLSRQYSGITFEHTEFFKNQHFSDGREKTVLFGAKCVTSDGETVVQDRGGWIKPSGKGWICYFQPGHLPDDFKQTAYQQILLNCLTWVP